MAILVCCHVPKQEQELLITNLFDSVKSGGTVMLEVYSEEQLTYRTGEPDKLENLYDPKDILKWIGDHTVIHFYYERSRTN